MKRTMLIVTLAALAALVVGCRTPAEPAAAAEPAAPAEGEEATAKPDEEKGEPGGTDEGSSPKQKPAE